jgi:CBS domain-containing protein
MKVEALMNPNVRYADNFASVADVIVIMEKFDCGVVPILNQQDKVIGMITDRDICLALGPRPIPAAGIAITDVMSKRVYACGPDEEISAALETMKKKKVRRLPVIDGLGKLVGILSMDDIVLRAEPEKAEEKLDLGYGRAVKTLKAIYKRHGAKTELSAHP